VERRKYARYSVCVEIEIKETGGDFPFRGSTSDLSLSGCYLATIFPLATDTMIDFTMWIAGENINGRGSVQTSDPGVGMGIKFIGLADEAAHRLDDYLHASVPAPQEEQLHPYLR
jgi:hypothetical protein